MLPSAFLRPRPLTIPRLLASQPTRRPLPTSPRILLDHLARHRTVGLPGGPALRPPTRFLSTTSVLRDSSNEKKEPSSPKLEESVKDLPSEKEPVNGHAVLPVAAPHHDLPQPPPQVPSPGGGFTASPFTTGSTVLDAFLTTVIGLSMGACSGVANTTRSNWTWFIAPPFGLNSVLWRHSIRIMVQGECSRQSEFEFASTCHTCTRRSAQCTENASFRHSCRLQTLRGISTPYLDVISCVGCQEQFVSPFLAVLATWTGSGHSSGCLLAYAWRRKPHCP